MRTLVFLTFLTVLHVKANELSSIDLDNYDGTDDWWPTASFYQIYPRSFKDSNGDGIGDLNGISQMLPYLKELGIKATWLSPIFKSPMADFGYDISNFFDIQPEYGTLADFDDLIATANDLGLKIILDFVPNHTSDENQWFKRSARRETYFEDFYIWHPGFPDPKNASNRLPPNNWVSVFHGSAWQYNNVRKEFYLHQFSVKQPDLNYRNPKVVDEMKSVLRFWLNRGVAGFRIDAVPFLFEITPDKNGNYPDEPLSGDTNDPNDWNYLKHIYTTDQNETVDMVYQWRAVMDEFKQRNGGDTRVIMTECYSSIEMVMRYFGDGTREGAQMPFNFQLIGSIRNESTATDYKAAIDAWMTHMPKGRTANWVIGNHDQNRVSSRLGTDRIDMINMMLLTLPGASVTYNGEEIGMTDVWISWKDTVDPAACNTNSSVYETFSRDPERTPFQWDDTVSAGFSTNKKTWLPVALDYKEVNVKRELADAKSHLKCYADLIKLRNTPTLRQGDLVTKAANDNVLVIMRHLNGEPSFITVANIGSSVESVNLKSLLTTLPYVLQYEIVGVSSVQEPGDWVSSSKVVLEPKESFVLRAIDPNMIGVIAVKNV